MEKQEIGEKSIIINITQILMHKRNLVLIKTLNSSNH